jgi:hypothetical protein
MVGLSVADLPDLPFRDLFEARVSPVEVAKRALRESGWF